MSDPIANPDALDPKRPWIEDHEQLPSQMDWVQSYVNPTGKSPKLHFTRGWTVLFFIQLGSWIGLGFLLSIIGMLGADTSGARGFVDDFIVVAFVITTLMSFVLHSRRLNHAGRSPLWALIVLVPLIVAGAQFFGGIQGKSAEYAAMYEKRETYLKDPITWRAEHLKERQAEQLKKAEQEAEAARKKERMKNPEQCLAEVAAEKEEAKRKAEEAKSTEGAEVKPEGRRQAGPRGPQGQGGFSPDKELPNQVKFILEPNMASVAPTMALLSFPIMLWSLLWVARAPISGAQYARKGLPNILLNPRGRIGRMQYWAGFAALLLVLGLAGAVAGIGSAIGAPVAMVSKGIAAAVGLLAVWMLSAMTSKRLHDMGLSAKTMLLPWVLTVLLAGIAAGIGMLFAEPIALHKAGCAESAPLIPTIASQAIYFIIAMAHVGFLALVGTTGPNMEDNDHGPAPIKGDEAGAWR